MTATEPDDTRRRMQIHVLGPLEAVVDDRPVSLGGAKQRAVLAMLGLEPNRAVTADRLIEGLWGDRPPPSAAKMVQNYVWRLRTALGGDDAQILTRGRGYELRIDPELVDVCRLERLVSEAARAAAAGQAADTAREALALFRGDPLADIADEPFAAAEIRRLEELRLAAAELALDADLAAGRHAEVIAEIEALTAANPLRERLHGLRMLALYRCGRQAEALEAYRRARGTLVEEIGVEPSPALQRLQEQILRQDPALDARAPAAEFPRELDAAAMPPLTSREGELRRLRAHWRDAARGAGALVTLAGGYGMGKTRLAAALAGEAQADGATVLLASGAGAPEAVLAVVARTRRLGRPALVVVDDADRAPAEVRAALRALGAALGGLPVLVLATGQEAAALGRLGAGDSVVLAPLGADGVRAVAGLYAPAGAAPPLDDLLAATGGVPRRVHEAAAEWARREATRRVDAAAGRAAAGRSEARALEAELAGSVVALQSTRERTGRLGGEEEDPDAGVVCPYKGLAAFDVQDAGYFFGRERLVAELVARLVGAPLLAVVGPSGSGKSSVVRAGLLPALAGGVLPGSQTWAQDVIRPGAEPLRALRRAQRRLAREWRSILVVDQFEELFTAGADEAERAEFVAAIVRAARGPGGERVVVLVVRADFYGRCAAYPELSELLGANHVLVGAMSRDELRRAIERPAERVCLSVEPELADALLADVEGRPGALPLLSTSLLELWREREGRRLRLAAYARSGGLHAAVARLAERAFVALDPAAQAAARRLLLRLAGEDPSGAVVRRRVALPDLEPDLAEVAGRLADARLLTLSEGTVEVAHEALLREWPRLRGWLEEDVEGRRLQVRLAAAARAWDADGRDPGGLYRGARLATTLDWAAEHDPELDATERTFLAEGRRASSRAQRRLRLILAGVASLLVLALIAGAVALRERTNARDEATAAAAQGLAAQALVEDDLDRALLFARQGVALHDTVQTRGNLLAALLRSPAVIGVLRTGDERPVGLALSPDGRALAVAGDGGTLSVFDTRTRRPAARPQLLAGLGPGPANDDVLRYSADGSALAVAGFAPRVLDARTLRAIARLPDAGPTDRLRFAADGRSLFALGGPPGGSVVLERLDARTSDRLAGDRRMGPEATGAALAVAHSGRWVLTSTDAAGTTLFDARTLRPLRRLRAGASQAELAPDDRTLVLGGRDGAVRFLDLATGVVRTASGRHGGPVVGATFGPGGRTAVTAGADNRIIVWDVARAAATETLAGHAGQVTGLAVSPDGRTLYTGSLDGTVLVWDLAGDRRLGRRVETGPQDRPVHGGYRPQAFDLRADGRSLAVGHGDGTVTLVDLRTGSRATLRPARGAAVTGVGYVPGARLLAVGDGRGRLSLVDPDSGRTVQRLSGHHAPLLGPVFSADGRVMLTASLDDVVQLWRLRDGRPTGPPRRYFPATNVFDASLSPDGRRFALTSVVGVDIVGAATLRRERTIALAGELPTSAQFSRDGRLLVVASFKRWARAYSTRTWRPVTRDLRGHTGEVRSASVSPDGRTLATGSGDGTVRLFDLRTGQPLGAPLPGVPNRVVAPVFTPDGAGLVAVTSAGRAYLWDVRPAAWARRACAVAGRRLSRAEWAEALPGRDYSPAC